ncbi:MAG: hypothetical protein ACTSSQ_03605, partial [Alphaproteobacteria bacterium]
MKLHLFAAACVLIHAAAAINPVRAQEPLRLHAPEAMRHSGFLTHILPRFRFKHRISVTTVPAGEPADMAILPDEKNGVQVFAAKDGGAFYLGVLSEDPLRLAAIGKFRDWLNSRPGKAAIEGFPPGGPSVYAVGAVEAVVAKTVEVDGDAVLGARLALVHCGRCHVIDKRNRMGGIGSTPSFAVMRARTAWQNLFLKFYVENPHPSFTQVAGVTEPFGGDRVAHIAPV